MREVPEDIPAHARARRADSRIHLNQGLHRRGGEEIDLVRFANEDALKAWKSSRNISSSAPRPGGVLRSLFRPGLQVVRDYEFRMTDSSRDFESPRGPRQDARSFIAMSHAPSKEVYERDMNDGALPGEA